MRHLLVVPLLGMLALLCAACGGDATAPPPTDPPAIATSIFPTATAEEFTPEPASGPRLVAQQPLGADTLYLIRYPAGEQECLGLSFDQRVHQVTECGAFAGPGGGYTATLTAPDGSSVAVTFGWADAAVTAVAVEFSGGGNSNVPAQEGFLLILGTGQSPARFVGVDQFGNLVGTWGLVG